MKSRVFYRRQVLRGALAATAALALTSCGARAARRQRQAISQAALSQLGQNTGFDGVGAALQAVVDAGQVRGAGLLVANAGRVLYVKSVGSFADDHVDEIASATKLASASTIMSLVDSGVLSLDDPVAKYLPSFTGAKAAITVRQCLSHTTGLPGFSLLLPPPGQDNGLSLAETVDRLARLPLVAQPGTRFAYGGVSYQVAGRVAEVAAGKSWADLFQERIFTPLGMTAFSYGATADPRIGGGASANLHDYGNLLRMHLAGGSFDGRQVLSEQSVRAMQRSQTGSAPFVSLALQRAFGYGLGWWFDAVDSSGAATRVSDAGAFGAIPWIDLAHSYGAFLFIRDRLQIGLALYSTLLPLVQAAVSG